MAKPISRPAHPGEILGTTFMRPLGLSSGKLARALGVSVPTVNEIVRQRRALTADMALRLSRFFGTTPEMWQEFQAAYELNVTRLRIATELEKIVPYRSVEPTRQAAKAKRSLRDR